MENEEPKDMPLLTTTALAALKGAFSKGVIFLAQKDAKWYQSFFNQLTMTDQALYPGTLGQVYATYNLPGMTAEKATRILNTAPFEIKRAQDKAAAGDAPTVQTRYAKAFGQVLTEAMAWTEQNVPAAATKPWYQNPLILIGAAGAAFLILPKLLKR
jgi:hypothetical protein